MFIEEYEPDQDERERDEYEHAMAEYYCKPVTVTCGYCNLTQTATEAQLREIGWTLEKGIELCFQAKCKRDRQAEYKALAHYGQAIAGGVA